MDLGTFWPSDPSVSAAATFGAHCSASADADVNDTEAWSFTNYHTFRLAADATGVYGGIDLNFTRDFGGGPNYGSALYMITTDSISFVHNGVSTFAGTEGAGHNEHASILGFNLEAGDYLMVIRGHVFGTPTRSGSYKGNLYVSYADTAVAAPVPEPATDALLLLGIPVVAWVAGRRPSHRATG